MFKKYFLKIRTLKILFIALFCGIILYQFMSLQHESNKVRLQQLDKFSYSLTNIAAKEASRYLSKKSPEELVHLIDHLSQDSVIRDATIYDRDGKIIYQSEQALPLTTVLKITGDNEQAEGIIPYIAEIYLDDSKIGYIRITLEEAKILSLLHDYEQHGLMILALLILISFITGLLIMAIFFKRAEVKYTDLRMHLPFITLRIKKQIQELIKKAQH